MTNISDTLAALKPCELCAYTFDDADSLSIHVEQIAKVVGTIIAALRAGEEKR